MRLVKRSDPLTPAPVAADVSSEPARFFRKHTDDRAFSVASPALGPKSSRLTVSRRNRGIAVPSAGSGHRYLRLASQLTSSPAAVRSASAFATEILSIGGHLARIVFFAESMNG